MTTSVLIHFLFGIALFLYGVLQMEDGIKQAQGRPFKLFLKKSTSTKLRAIASGTLITSLLQSSSIVNLTLLSFIGAGTLPLGNALGMVLGANIGGTFNSWLLAWAGFSSGGLQVLALPLIAFSGCAMMVFRSRKMYQQFLKIFMGLGFLLFGLDHIKQSTLPVFSHLDLTRPGTDSRLVIFFVGLGITALIQTSSATVAIVMSTLHSGVIPLPMAISVVLGAELGTTVKVAIAALNGSKAQKQLAAANIAFNLGSALFGFIFLTPIADLLHISGIQNPVILLASFQTLINIVSALLFWPLLNPLAHLLERYFKDHDGKLTPYIQSAVPGVPDAPAELLEKETGLFLKRVIALNTMIFGGKIAEPDKHENGGPDFASASSLTYQEKYLLLKKAEGAILDYYSRLETDNLSTEARARSSRMISAVRSAMYSAKGMKDISANLNELSNSGNDEKFNLYLAFKKQLEDIYGRLELLLKEPDKAQQLLKLRLLLETAVKNYNEQAELVFRHVAQKQLKALEIATVFNISREVFSSLQSLMMSLNDFLLEPSEAVKFENAETAVTAGKYLNQAQGAD